MRHRRSNTELCNHSARLLAFAARTQKGTLTRLSPTPSPTKPRLRAHNARGVSLLWTWALSTETQQRGCVSRIPVVGFRGAGPVHNSRHSLAAHPQQPTTQLTTEALCRQHRSRPSTRRGGFRGSSTLRPPAAVRQFSHIEIRCDARNAASGAVAARLGLSLVTPTAAAGISAESIEYLQVWRS
jgi:hypothetical protein